MVSAAGQARTFRIVRWGERARPALDSVTVEEPLEIRVGRTTIAVTMRTPGHDRELAAGFLLAEGLVSHPDEIARLEYCRTVRSPEEEGNVLLARISAPEELIRGARRLSLTTSSCGLCGRGSIAAVRRSFHAVARGPAGAVKAATLRELPGRLLSAQETFGRTGGLHAAGVFGFDGVPRAIREDVGRHNAVDKALGAMFLGGATPLSASILMVSGRASFEVVQKALAAGVPVVAAVSAPSSLAIELARSAKMTLVGFLRSGGFNIYSGADRVAPASRARRSGAGTSRSGLRPGPAGRPRSERPGR